MGTPVVTAVVTSYKREYAIVKRAIDSIVGQTYNNIEYNNVEILLIDDNRGEEGKTYSEALMALEKISPIIKIHHTKDRHGSQVARNLGISLAKGRYIAFLDDDDEWLPEKLAEQVIYMDSHPETGLCYCNGYIVYEGSDKNKRIPRFDGNFTSDTDYRGLLREDVIGSTSQALIRREVFDKVGLFDEALPASQDYEM
ncbi:MAG: glycosyltransferase [Lachnospiraceae bacterium]|nr:glycosyltransferase [Lachnospiraceae bacterium]